MQIWIVSCISLAYIACCYKPDMNNALCSYNSTVVSYLRHNSYQLSLNGRMKLKRGRNIKWSDKSTASYAMINFESDIENL